MKTDDKITRRQPLAQSHYTGVMNNEEFIALKTLIGDAMRQYDRLVIWTQYDFLLANAWQQYEFRRILDKFGKRLQMLMFDWNSEYEKAVEDHPKASETIPPVIAQVMTSMHGGAWIDIYPYILEIHNSDLSAADAKANESLGMNFMYVKYLYPKDGMETTYKDNDDTTNPLYWNVPNYIEIDIAGHQYPDFPENTHHAELRYVYDVLMPQLCGYLKVNYVKEDFTETPAYSDDESHSYCGYLTYNKDANFTIECDSIYGNVTTGNASILNGIDTQYCAYAKTQYHNIYACAHAASKVTNHTIESNRILLITGDSHMLPFMQVLPCYFKKVIYLHNRYRNSQHRLYENENITDYLMFTSPSYPLYQYMTVNFL